MFPVFPVDFFGLYYCGSAARQGRGLYLSFCCLLGSNQKSCFCLHYHQLKTMLFQNSQMKMNNFQSFNSVIASNVHF